MEETATIAIAAVVTQPAMFMERLLTNSPKMYLRPLERQIR
jgi:hypothetical protein